MSSHFSAAGWGGPEWRRYRPLDVGATTARHAGTVTLRQANGASAVARCRKPSAADGGHAALYLMGDGPRGISLELVSTPPKARVARLIRLR